MKKILVIAIGLVLVLLFVGTLAFLYKRSKVQPVVYETQKPFVTDIVKKTVATGSVVPRKEVEIKPRVSGIVDQLYVQPGDKVEVGDRVARIRVVPNMLSLTNAQNAVAQAHIDLDKAKQDFDRNQPLHAQGLISDEAFAGFQIALQHARAELRASEDSLAVIREGAPKEAAQTANTMIRATISGMVLDVPVEVGNSVIEANNFNDGTTIASVADMDEMVFEGKVDESEVGKLQEGMDLELTVAALEDERFHARLEYIAPKGVEDSGAIQFEIRAATDLKPDVFLRANYSANADIVLGRRDHVLAVKESWLQFDGDNPYVEVQQGNNQYVRRDIKTGLSDGINIEVVSGLTADDLVKDPNSGHPPGSKPESQATAAAG